MKDSRWQGAVTGGRRISGESANLCLITQPTVQGEEYWELTTTPNIEGKRVTKYLGIVAGEAILGANLFKDLFAGIRDLVGGRSATYEKELQRARDIALGSSPARAGPGRKCSRWDRYRLRNNG